ncbi:MAG: recombinase family protein [Bdellovibrionales bacterium]|nr:recombinase family protein [Bdellovibrionales bacterium]NQZ19240.1 recombinase family protein [Bdellovibrionales bacterium]
MKHIAIYGRCSTSHQKTGLEGQIRAVRGYCESQGITNIQTYEDFGISGGKISRPELNRLIGEIKNNTVSAVYVYSISRLSRSLKDLLNLLQVFEEYDVHFESITASFNLNTPIGKALIAILGSLAEMERNIISQRTKRGLANCKAKGIRLGRPNSINVNLIKELRLQNFSYRKIASLANCSIGSVSSVLSDVQKKVG